MRVVFLVPRREDNGHRDKLWEWCKARWEQYFPDIPIFEGHHTEGLFNRAAAVNKAAQRAGDWDIGIILDSDVFLKVSQVRQAIETAHRTGRVTWAHRRWREFSEYWTGRILEDRRDLGPEFEGIDLDIFVQRTTPISWSCCIAVPRAIWDDIGGMDERFEGWGFEDMAFQSLIVGLYGHERIEGDVLNLWHPRSPERIIKGEPRSTASRAYITNARLGRRYMLAARRDHGMHDRPDPSDAAEMERDIANLKLDDAKWSREAKRHGLPDWDEWWPTLEELRDGAKAHRTGPSPTITVVVHSGGAPENWPARREYLLQSIASLNENVTGPIVQRVVYSDWGREIDMELAGLVEPFGFYVAGPQRHLGYTQNMQQMWRYLGKRARGSHIFQAEDDFLYTRPVDLGAMLGVLEQHPDVAQITLLREAFYEREFEKGTILGWPLAEFTSSGNNGTSMLTHRLFWSQNPSLFRKSITDTAWPLEDSSERIFGNILTKKGKRFALWGDGEPYLRHIGSVRAGESY
jgi:hypothetical protein